MNLKHYTSKVRRAVLAASVAAVSVPSMLFAQSANPVDLSAAGTAADNIGSAIKDLLTGKILDNVQIIVGAALVVWAIFLVVRYVRRGGK